MTTGSKSPYRMTLGLNVLKHLGFGLYSNVPAVLAEVVANSWDADAQHVFEDLHVSAVPHVQAGSVARRARELLRPASPARSTR